MSKKFEHYLDAPNQVPAQSLAWNMYGPGVENIGKDGQPESSAIPEPGDNQILVRVDSVGMCFSDVKLIQQGGSHPKLYNRDLSKEPTRLGHEAALTVVKVGKSLEGQFNPGERYAVQPDIYQDGLSTAYGYTIPGGLVQYHLIGPEVIDADDGSYLIPLAPSLGYAESALTEPWACVDAAYTQRRRLSPQDGGWMWIIGHPDDSTPYTFTSGLDAPDTIVLTNVSSKIKALVNAEKARGATIIERNGYNPETYEKLREELTAKRGFDDIIVLGLTSSQVITEAAKQIAFRGTLNVIGSEPLDGPVDLDVGRIHYHYTAYVGGPGPEISAAYGEARNRADLVEGGTAVFIGAGGPMGQMHVQRAIEMPGGPALVIATDVNKKRLDVLGERFGPMAAKRGKRLVTINPAATEKPITDIIAELTDGKGADDVVVSVPHAGLIEESARLVGKNGMLVLFAGVPNGTYASIGFSDVFMSNKQFTGTSGSSLQDQADIVDKVIAKRLSPNRSVAAVGGMEAAREGIEAMMTGRYAGKVVIFPQLKGLSLMGLDELAETYPDLGEMLGPDLLWNRELEEALVEKFWEGNHDE